MSLTIAAIYENGMLKPLEKIKLPNHRKIRLVILPVEKESLRLVKSQVKTLKTFCGVGKNGPRDVSSHHDKYLDGE